MSCAGPDFIDVVRIRVRILSMTSPGPGPGPDVIQFESEICSGSALDFSHFRVWVQILSSKSVTGSLSGFYLFRIRVRVRIL